MSKSEITDAGRAARAAYLREWRHRNPDKVKAQNERYWNKKAAATKAAEGNEEDS